jgi:hypothetical protein
MTRARFILLTAVVATTSTHAGEMAHLIRVDPETTGTSVGFCFYRGPIRGADTVLWTVRPRDGAPCPGTYDFPVEDADSFPESDTLPAGVELPGVVL